MSSLNEEKTNKMDDIVQMQACIKSDLMDIRTNMQFLSEFVSIMISSAMDEILRWSGDMTNERGVGQKEATKVGDQEHHGTGGSDKDQEESPTAEPTSKLPVKRVFSQRGYCSLLSLPDRKGENYSSTMIMLSFLRITKTMLTRLTNQPSWVGSKGGKSFRDWRVLQGIELYVKVLPALMNALEISKKDPNYQEPEAKELKVIIDDTLPQQTNGHDYGIFVVLYALYLIRGDRCSIPKKFDAS
ncbi:Hypothetical predicted protein [Olea europaea subsp. europaea]|uniref:Uncharacterized protein n=1 Tax=Olea europaea subsp. europaea TaxID=158383 RepID=A0A8S0R9A8_OLEEU|nr:Hypothetical predicted protein [Olea europaea subsp. europaea]